MRRELGLREIPDLPSEIIQAGLNGELILFVGAGISKLSDFPSWNELAWKTLHSLRQEGWLNFSELEQIKYLDPKKQLSIAKQIADENHYDLDFKKYFPDKTEENSIYRSINEIGCVCVTTNYDKLLEPRFQENNGNPSKSIMPNKAKHISDKSEFLPKYLDEPGTVIHLHGSIANQEFMIVTTKQYLEHYADKTVQYFLHELFLKKVVLFIGYGLEETEILEHILKSGAVKSTKDRRRFVLQGYFRSHESLYKNLHQYYEESFGVHLIGFMRDHKDYAQQESIFRDWAQQIQVRKPTLDSDIALMDEVLGSV